MRVWFPHLVAAALVLVVAVLVITSMEGEARRYIMTDGFSGTDGSAPDTSKWEVNAFHGSREVYVRDGLLHTDMDGHQHCDAVMLNDFVNENVTMTVDFKVERDVERPVEIGYLWDVGSTGYAIIVYYDQEGWDYLGVPGSPSGDLRNLQVGHWYSVEFNVTQNVLDFHLRDRANNATIMSFEDLSLPEGGDRHHFSIGVGSYTNEQFPHTVWDNFALYDPYMDPNVLPKWLTVPSLQAREDVVLIYDFSAYVYDDQPPGELSITSRSEYVIGYRGLEVDFLFPNNVTSADVPLVLSDGYASVPKTVHVAVTPVNDPPEHSIPGSLNAPEGIPRTIDLSEYIWDQDSPAWEIQLLISSPYISVDGLSLVVGFPEGVTDHQVQLGITDGYDITWVTLNFLITPVNNPPSLLPIDDVTVTEDEPLSIDISSLVSDPDDDKTSLTVTVITERSDHCTVDGLVITFLYPDGGFTDTVTVRVSDGFGHDQETLDVRVMERNDPPVIDTIPVQDVYEDEATRIDLGQWISDEDHTVEQLVVSSDHPSVLFIVGMGMNVLFTEGGFTEVIPFTVTDGAAEVPGQLGLRVVEVNDPPRITGVGDMEAPYVLGVPGNAKRTFRITAVDADDGTLRFSVDSTWDIFSVAGDQLTVETDRFHDGTYIAFLNVYDNRGGSHRVKLTATVVPRSQLPVEVHIVSPVNHSSFDPGDVITFRVRVIDPEGYLTDQVTVTWASDLLGELGTLDLSDGGDLTISEMPEGRHTVHAIVSDGELTFTHWMVVDVGDVSARTSGGEESVLCTALTLLAIIVIMGIIVGVVVARGGGDVEPEPSRAMAASTAPAPAPKAPRDEMVERDRAARRRRLEVVRERERAEVDRAAREEEARMARIKAQQAAEERRKADRERRFTTETRGPKTVPEGRRTAARAPAAPPPAAPSPAAVRGELPSEELMELRRKQLVEALGRVPGGLPSSLDLYDDATIASRIIKGRKRWSPDGRLLAFVQGAWYYVDPGDGEFMRSYEGP